MFSSKKDIPDWCIEQVLRRTPSLKPPLVNLQKTQTRGPFYRIASIYSPTNIAISTQQEAQYLELSEQADPLADQVAQWLAQQPHNKGWQQINLALENGIDSIHNPAPELQAFFKHVTATPEWVNIPQMNMACRAISRSGIFGYLTLGSLALVGGYLSGGAAKPLVLTGQLEKMAPRRLAETASWWLDVTSCNGMQKGAAGYQNTIKVRLMHAHVRQMLNKHSKWDTKQWGVPINQAQMSGTLLLFSIVCMLGLRSLGFKYSPEERQAIMHLWRYIGWLMGVNEALIPLTEADAWKLIPLLEKYEFKPTVDSQKLTGAYMNSLGRSLAHLHLPKINIGQFILNYNMSYSRLAFGKDWANFLGLPNDTFAQTLVLATRPSIRLLEEFRSRSPTANKAAYLAGRRARRRINQQVVSRLKADIQYQPKPLLTTP